MSPYSLLSKACTQQHESHSYAESLRRYTLTLPLMLQAVQWLLEGQLLGTGNVVRQLSTLGFPLQFEQSALHEFDFSINVLAVDLRDGIRLCKLTEMLTGAHRHPAHCALSVVTVSCFCHVTVLASCPGSYHPPAPCLHLP